MYHFYRTSLIVNHLLINICFISDKWNPDVDAIKSNEMPHKCINDIKVTKEPSKTYKCVF